MTYKTFMEKIQEYYGGYPENSIVQRYVMGYLKRDIDEKKLSRLFRFLTYNHAVRFGAPSISDIEKSIYEALRNKKGEDPHKTIDNNTMEDLTPVTEKEYEEGNKLLEDAGGLTAIFKKTLEGKKVAKI